MPFTDAALQEALTALTPELTAYLHVGNPGTAGTANRVATTAIGSATIPVNGFTISGGTATAVNDLDFGDASADITGISWVSVFAGSTFYARRELAAAMDVSDGSGVNIAASSITFTVTSIDT